jgi:hypothetical protein
MTDALFNQIRRLIDGAWMGDRTHHLHIVRIDAATLAILQYELALYARTREMPPGSCRPAPLAYPPTVWSCDCNGDIRGYDGVWVPHDDGCRSRKGQICAEFELHPTCME